MNQALSVVVAWATWVAVAPVQAQITLFDQDDYRGRSLTVEVQSGHLGALSFNDRASSAVVNGGAWELCTNANFAGRCTVLRPGQYPALQDLGMDDRVTSLRPHGDNPRDGQYKTERERNTALAAARTTAMTAAERSDNGRSTAGAYDARRRGNERLFVVTLTSVREVRGNAERRCWVELPLAGGAARPAPAMVPGTASAAVLATAATAASAKASANGLNKSSAIGASKAAPAVIAAPGGNATTTTATIATTATATASTAAGFLGHESGSDGGDGLSSQGLPSCATVGKATPISLRVSYWDAGYDFRGVAHRVQMNTAPLATLTVNERGEPRQ